jgi:hypothetical protein
MQGDGRFDHLYRYVGRGAERAVRVGEISIGVNVDCLDGSARNDQRNTQQSEDELPSALAFRI